MKIFSGSSHTALTQAIAKELHIPLGLLERKQFSCNENYVRYQETVRDQSVFLVQTGTQNSNQDLMELLLLCQAAKLGFAKEVHVVLPYFPYARQDRVALPREPIGAKLVADLLQTAGATHVITLDLHSNQIQGFFDIPVDCLHATHVFANYVLAKQIQNPVIVSPDAGGAKRAKKFADMLGADLAIMHKSRPKHQVAEVVDIVGNIEERTCIIFDDIIDTGTSLLLTRQALLERKANAEMYAIATHGIFSNNAIQTIAESGFTEVIVSNSVPIEIQNESTITIIDTAPMFAEVIQRISDGKSVTTMYE